MNPENELNDIRQKQYDLHDRIRDLDSQIKHLEVRLKTPEPAPVYVPEPAIVTAEALPEPTPPPIPHPVEIPTPVLSKEEESKEPAPQNKDENESGALEMKLGSYWFVRVGVTMLLTGFVFLANYAREQFFNILPAGGKVTILYILSGLLLATGLWLERRREQLKNYARVLSAGGIAAVYYTTYAAHKVPTLRIIDSPVIAGLLLLIWAGVLLFVSHRRNSQALAMTSVFFAYVTCIIIDQATNFTLFSALVLTVVGVFLLMHSRWLKVSIVSLIGTYVTFAYWRLPMLVEWLRSTPPDSQNFLLTYTFLIAYWTLFTFAVFASKKDALPDKERSFFAISNNAAFILLFSLGMLRHLPDQFGLFLLIVGAIFIGLHILARRKFPDIRTLSESYLISGTLAMTLGAIMHFSGYSLALTLAAESTALLIASRRTNNDFLEGMSYAAAILCALFVTNSALQMTPRLLGIFPITAQIHWLAALAGSLFLLVNGRIYQTKGSATYVICGLVILYFGCIHQLTGAAYAVTLSLTAVGFSCTHHFLRYRSLATIGQIFAVLAAVNYVFYNHSQPLWAGLIVIPAVLFLAYWWRDVRDIGLDDAETTPFRDALSIFGILTLALWINRILPTQSHWIWLGGLLAIGTFIAGAKTRMPAITVTAIGFHFPAVLHFLDELHRASGPLLLVPILLIAATPLIIRTTIVKTDSWYFAFIGIIALLKALTVILSTIWITQFIDDQYQPLTFGLIAIGATTLRKGRIFAMAFLLIGAAIWSIDVFDRPPYGWANGLFCFVPLAMQVLVKMDNSQLTPWLASASSLMIWRYVTGLVDAEFGGFYLTVSWALVAGVLFAIGFLLRQKEYRWAGLGILAFSIIRLAFDAWALAPLPRILSFIALGLVLVALGFVYNRWQDTIRKFL